MADEYFNANHKLGHTLWRGLGVFLVSYTASRVSNVSDSKSELKQLNEKVDALQDELANVQDLGKSTRELKKTTASLGRTLQQNGAASLGRPAQQQPAIRFSLRLQEKKRREEKAKRQSRYRPS